MPKYRVKELSLIGNELHQAGAIVSYDGLPAENLEPLDAEGEAKYQEYLESNKQRVAAMDREHGKSAVGDPEAFMKALAKDRAEQNANIAATIATAVAETLARLFPAGLPVAAAPLEAPVAASAEAAAPAKGSKAKDKTDGPTTGGADSLV